MIGVGDVRLKQKDPNDDIKGRCERTEERLKATKLRLREVSAEFKQAVGRKSPSRSGDAAKLAELLSGPHWSRVVPAGMWLRGLAPPSDATADRIPFDPSQWPDVSAEPLRVALEECHQAFVNHNRVYHTAVRRLSEEELQKLFPAGPPRP